MISPRAVNFEWVPGRAGAALGALAAAAALVACSSVSLGPAPVRVVNVPPPAAPPARAANPAPPTAAPAPAAPVAVASPVAPPTPPTGAPLAADEPALTESPGVAARFPEPAVSYRTPAFAPGRTTFTSNAELQSLLRGLVREESGSANATTNATTIRLVQVGSSQAGVPLDALYFTRDPGGAAPGQSARPTVLLVGQQHGDEPAGSEALLVIAQELAQGRLQPLLERINVVLLARANPDGAAAGKRVSASGIDINRDHLLLRTPEAQAIATLARDFDPAVVVDAHEYSVLGRYLDKFGAVQRYDVMLQLSLIHI